MSIVVDHISKSYQVQRALQEVTFEVAAGELFGLIGPDGAGKTTLFRILTTLLRPDSGNATVDGTDLQHYKAIRRKVGYMPGKFSLYPDLSVDENLRFFASIFQTKVADNRHLVNDIYQQLAPFKDRRAGALSGGMKQKLALCCALIHKPAVLFLDEPTTGVDPVSRHEFWQMLGRLKETGISILVSTAYMDEASWCDRVALMQLGQVLQCDTPQGICASFKSELYAIRASSMFALLKAVEAIPTCHSVYPFGEYLHYMDTRPDVKQEELIQYLESLGLQDVMIKQVAPTIEDVFMEQSVHANTELPAT